VQQSKAKQSLFDLVVGTAGRGGEIVTGGARSIALSFALIQKDRLVSGSPKSDQVYRLLQILACAI